jgi:pimeloyl-ACP methyl ester carboxylesterase
VADLFRLPPLVAPGRRVICPDYPGFGRSDKPTDRRWYGYDRHVEHVTALLDSLDLREATAWRRTGWPDRVALGGRERRAGGAARDPQHGSLHWTAALVAFSDSDPVFPYPQACDFFCELIPGADEQVRIAGAAPFLQEDRGERIAEEIMGFLGT